MDSVAWRRGAPQFEVLVVDLAVPYVRVPVFKQLDQFREVALTFVSELQWKRALVKLPLMVRAAKRCGAAARGGYLIGS